jgi:gliding motility-associated-like protein
LNAANAGTGGHICGSDFAFNAILTGGTGTWSKISGPGNEVYSPDTHQPFATVHVDQTGTYDFAWRVNNNSCNSEDIVRVIFHELPLITESTGSDATVCKGANIQLHAQGTGFFSWSPPDLFSNPNISDPVATPVASTTLTVTLTDQFGCRNSVDINVIVKDQAVANAGPDQVLESQFSTIMNAVLYTTDETGVWSLIAGNGEFYDSTNPKASVDGLAPERNKFLWTVKNGVCPPSSDTVEVIVGDMLIPTLITPNMDGKNDYLIIGGSSATGKIELVIFDRRGAQVYKNLNYDNLWNGIDYNKNPLPEDTYFYLLKTKNAQSVKGYVVIRR